MHFVARKKEKFYEDLRCHCLAHIKTQIHVQESTWKVHFLFRILHFFKVTYLNMIKCTWNYTQIYLNLFLKWQWPPCFLCTGYAPLPSSTKISLLDMVLSLELFFQNHYLHKGKLNLKTYNSTLLDIYRISFGENIVILKYTHKWYTYSLCFNSKTRFTSSCTHNIRLLVSNAYYHPTWLNLGKIDWIIRLL